MRPLATKPERFQYGSVALRVLMLVLDAFSLFDARAHRNAFVTFGGGARNSSGHTIFTYFENYYQLRFHLVGNFSIAPCALIWQQGAVRAFWLLLLENMVLIFDAMNFLES